MYKESILMILTWPALILVCWVAVRIALYFYEKKQKDTDPKNSGAVQSQ